MQMKITLLGWYSIDENLFDGLIVPDGLDKETVIDSILMRCGEFNIIYSNLDFLKFAIRNWSERHKTQFEKMMRALTEDYNPVHNYDRYEEFSDTKNGNRKTDGSLTSKTVSENTQENTISADNVSDYQPDNKTTNETKNDTTNVDSNAESYTDNIKHNAHLYGNIGVTTSMAMVKEEIDLRNSFGIYDLIAAKFVEEFCIVIY